MITMLNLAAAHARIGRLAIIAAALVIGIVALGAPAAAEAAGNGAQTAGASENELFTFLLLLFGIIFAASAAAGAVAGAVM